MLEQTALFPCKKCKRDEKHLERFSTDEGCCILCACGHSGPIQVFGYEAESEWNKLNAPDDLDNDEIDHDAEEKYWYRRDEQG